MLHITTHCDSIYYCTTKGVWLLHGFASILPKSTSGPSKSRLNEYNRRVKLDQNVLNKAGCGTERELAWLIEAGQQRSNTTLSSPSLPLDK